MAVSDREAELTRLLSSATTHKENGEWAAAVACLYLAKSLLRKSWACYPAETWCRLPLYLQQAGLFAESIKEFQLLLDDLPRRARRDAQLDNPNIGSEAMKLQYFQGLLENDSQTIRDKQALAMKRESKRKAGKR